jgi:transposase
LLFFSKKQEDLMGRIQRYEVRLTEKEQKTLLELTSKGKISAREMKRAQAILKSDKNGEGLEDEEIAKALGIGASTVFRVRKSFCKDRLNGIVQKKGAGRPSIIDGDFEAHLIAIACSPAPEGHVRWTLRLIADKVVTLTEFDSLSHQTVYRTLKKMNLSLG